MQKRMGESRRKWHHHILDCCQGNTDYWHTEDCGQSVSWLALNYKFHHRISSLCITLPLLSYLKRFMFPEGTQVVLWLRRILLGQRPARDALILLGKGKGRPQRTAWGPHYKSVFRFVSAWKLFTITWCFVVKVIHCFLHE